MAHFLVPGIGLVLACLSRESAAHGAAGAADDVTGWSLVLALLLVTSAVLYAVGVRRLWRRAGARRGVRGAHVLRFAIGWLVLASALLSPIDALADRSFAVHMLQHELLMLVAAPLFVLARPLEAWTWALPQHLRRPAANVAHAREARAGWHVMTSQSGAWCLHASALWIWHVPVLFIAAVANPSLHVVQHTCFLGSALIFWWSVLRDRAGSHAGGAMLAVFTTMLHTGALGALITLAPHPMYLAAGQTTIFGLSALEDQQLGGLIMWVPGGLAYVVTALAIVAARLSPPRVHHDVA